MKKRKRNNPSAQSEQLFMPWFDTLFNPTIEMAAELMNVSNDVIKEWLAQEHLDTNNSDRLTDSAIDFLAQKYVSRLHKYFDNCVASWDSMTPREMELFSRFKRKYGKFYSFWVTEWEEIETKRIIRDFKEELKRKAQNAYFEELKALDFTTITVTTSQEIDSYPILYFKADPKEQRILLYAISQSLYYGSRIKTKIPAKPQHREINLEILQENRFHIFTGESEDNVQIDAISSSTNVNQPQLAIVHVFGYQRHKNIPPYECNIQNKTYYSRPSQ